MKKKIRHLLNLMGVELTRFNQKILEPASTSRPVGRMDYLLQDVKMRGLKCRSILDVGANTGSWSKMASDIFPDCNFYLIEPQIEMKHHLESFCNENKNARYFLAGAGAKKEKLTLTIWDDLSGSSFLPAEDERLKNDGKQREIDIITIDEMILENKIGTPDLMKLDIQGFELEALKGAESTFGKTEVYILEVSLFSYEDVPGLPDFAEVINFMRDRNYVVYDFPGFLRRPSDGALGQCDICFVKQDGFLRKIKTWN